VPVLVGLAVVVGGFATSRVLHALSRPVDADLHALHDFLATLPKTALVAAHPADADRIPLRAKRAVLASDETAQPYWLGYYEPERERLEASLRACYATSWTDLDAFATGRHVAVFVTNADRYDDARRDRLREPFGSLEASIAAAGKSAGFTLASPPAVRVLFRRGRYAVVRLGP
jgi:hypothetical protein